MKKLLWIIILFSGIFLYSCEDLLDRTPLDQISDPDFWSSEADLQLYLNRLYDGIEGWWVSGGGKAPTYDTGTDLVLPPPNVYGDDWTPRLDGVVQIPASGGGWNWTNIRNINYFLENADRVEEGGDMVDHYIGEGYLFRAGYYFELLKKFGDLPIITKPVSTDDEDILYGSRNSRTEVTDFILGDIDMAISKMKYGHELTAHGTRYSKDIALLFKARVALYVGTWEKYHQGTVFGGDTDGSGYLQQAANAAKQVIDDGNYSLVTGDTSNVYAELFNKVDYTGNPEVLFFKHFDRETYGSDFSNQLWNWPNGYGLTQDLTRYYLCSDGLPTDVSPLFVGDSIFSLVDVNRDPRLVQTIMIPGDIRRIEGTDTTYYDNPDLYNCGTGYESQKFRHIIVDPAVGVMNHNVDYILFRFAEALLIYAEARAELGLLTQDDVDLTINKLRDRVGMPHMVLGSITPDPNWPDYGYPLSDELYEIRRERVTELYGEGFRFDDLMRWMAHNYWVGKRFIGTYYTEELKEVDPNMLANEDGYLDPLMNSLNGPNGGYGFNPDKDYLLPL
ncbi:MAG TPA: hypothetical protein DEQ09_02155, partial [Bacteroidales bacterium]|nr:hypothetical protein [Bacteroidales bacterium]